MRSSTAASAGSADADYALGVLYKTGKGVAKDDREADFIKLRLAIAAGESWVGDLHDRIQPKKK